MNILRIPANNDQPMGAVQTNAYPFPVFVEVKGWHALNVTVLANVLGIERSLIQRSQLV